ncbi:DUF3592 domain-containing protein [Olsenella phocaeensis]|uniref:DUF3592 domain-containing protein n=1 Tax=Olsenella phocaeensis TaxID=1852385 RepID=UPI003A925C60
MESFAPDSGIALLCAWMSASIAILCYLFTQGSSSRKRGTGWKVLAAAGIIVTLAIFALPETASALVTFAYTCTALLCIGAYGVVWGISKATARRRCTAQVEATITDSRIIPTGKSYSRVYTATFDYQDQTYEADDLSGRVDRAAAGYRPPEPPAGPANRKPTKRGREPLGVGDPCTLLVNPREPAEAIYVNEHNVAAGIATALLGVFMMALAGFTLAVMLNSAADVVAPLLPTL